MAIDPVNWRREMKKFVGAELTNLKEEIANLRGDSQPVDASALSKEINALRREISYLREDFNSLTELVRILAANQMLSNVESEISQPTQKTSTVKVSVPIQKNFDAISNDINDLRDEIFKLHEDFNSLAKSVEISSNLPPTVSTSPKDTTINSNGNSSRATTTIQNRTGIHARPASVFVQTASKFKSKVRISAKGKNCDAKSILMLMSMGLTKGTEVTITAEGPDAKDAVRTLVNLIDDKFGEE